MILIGNFSIIVYKSRLFSPEGVASGYICNIFKPSWIICATSFCPLWKMPCVLPGSRNESLHWPAANRAAEPRSHWSNGIPRKSPCCTVGTFRCSFESPTSTQVPRRLLSVPEFYFKGSYGVWIVHSVASACLCVSVCVCIISIWFLFVVFFYVHPR